MKTLAKILIITLLAYTSLFSFGKPAQAAATLVQSKSGEGGAGAVTTITMDSSTTVGNTLIILIGNYYSVSAYGFDLVTTDNKSNTWATSTIVDNYPTIVQGTAQITTGGASHQITVTPTAIGAGSTGGAYYVFTVLEYSGLVTSSVLDKSAAQFQSSGSAYSSTATAATTQADELLLGYNVELSTGMTFTPDAPWTTVLTQPASFHTSHIQTRTVSATGTYSSTGNMSGASGNHSHSITTYKIAGAAGGGGSTPLMDDGQWFMLFD
jgi:hypothetical protein